MKGKRFVLFSTAVFVLLALCAVAAADVAIDENSFPDPVFRNYVAAFDTNGDGTLSDGELAAVSEINLKETGVENLGGIEFFTSLTYLDCTSNALSALDVSKLTKLETLWCTDNNLEALKIDSNLQLTQLGCAENKLKSLSISKNKKLTELYCNSNKFTELTVSASSALTKLVKKATRVNTGDGYDYWVSNNAWLYTDSNVTVTAGKTISRPVDASITVTVKNGIYRISGNEATLIGPADFSQSVLEIPDAVKANKKSYKVTSVSPFACENMPNLTTLKIGKYLKTLGNACFTNCVNLKTVTGGSALTAIGDSAFSGDESLTKFVFCSGIKTIGKSAFADCIKLKTILFKTTLLTAKSIGSNAFKNIDPKATVTCPAGMAKEYKTILLKKGMGKKVKFK